MKKYTVLLALALVACQTQEYIGKDVIEDETLEIVATKASAIPLCAMSTAHIRFMSKVFVELPCIV